MVMGRQGRLERIVYKVVSYSVFWRRKAGQVSRSEKAPPASPPAPPRKRKRHEAWVKANRLARSFFARDTVRREVELANDYWEDTGDKALVLCNVLEP